MNNTTSMTFSTPTLPEMLANAETNIARTIEPAGLTRLHKRRDTSDEHYFLALIESVFRWDPLRYQQPGQPQLGDHWRDHIDRSRWDALSPYFKDMYQVATYERRDRRRIFRDAALPQRFKYHFEHCVRLARKAIDIVSDPEFGSLHAFFERFVRLDGGWEQPVLRAALQETFGSIVSCHRFISEAGLSRSVSPGGVRILQRLGIVSIDDSQRFPSETESQHAAVFYQDVASATGHPFGYVEAAFAANCASSRYFAQKRYFWLGPTAVCFDDGPKCDICAHADHCLKRGVEELVRDRNYGWLSLYPHFHTQLVAERTTLGRLPDAAIDAVLLCISSENAFDWHKPLPVPSRDDLGGIRASLAYVSADILRDIWHRWASEVFPEARTLDDYARELGPVGELVDHRVPCLLAMLGWSPFAGNGDALLAEYLRRGYASVPVLAIDWAQLGDVVSEQLRDDYMRKNWLEHRQ
jgi:hypothetical protein